MDVATMDSSDSSDTRYTSNSKLSNTGTGCNLLNF